MIAIVRQRGPITHLDLQRRLGLPQGTERMTLMFGPYWYGLCREFCATFCPLAWRGVLRVVKVKPGWTHSFRIAIGRSF